MARPVVDRSGILFKFYLIIAKKNAMHKRFILFEDGPEREGGLLDIMKSFDSLEEVHKHFEEEEDVDFEETDYLYYVYDRIEGKIVWQSDPDFIFQYW